jgi:hypothetical protein
VAGGEALPDEVVDQIVDRTDGVPLFIEELTKSVLESGVPLVGIPTTLHDSLMARLDRLASVRLVAQIGAAIGRQFPYALLRAVSDLSEDELHAALARLVASELVFQRDKPPDAIYTFKHALVQDAAHGSLLRSTRQQLHGQIAAALEDNFPELMDSQPELFAQHYAEAGLVEKSVTYWGKAGDKSTTRSVMAEAAAQFRRGLDQLALLPDTRERGRKELELRSGLGAALLVVKGYAAPETGDTYARARELWERLGSPSEFLQVPFGQSTYHLYRGELDLALRLYCVSAVSGTIPWGLFWVTSRLAEICSPLAGSRYLGRISKKRSRSMIQIPPARSSSSSEMTTSRAQKLAWALSSSAPAFRTRQWPEAAPQSLMLEDGLIRPPWLATWQTASG